MKVNSNTDLVFTVNGTVMKPSKSSHIWQPSYQRWWSFRDVHTNIKKMNGAFVKLYPVWRNKYILLRTKIQLFNTNVKPGILYRCGI